MRIDVLPEPLQIRQTTKSKDPKDVRWPNDKIDATPLEYDRPIDTKPELPLLQLGRRSRAWSEPPVRLMSIHFGPRENNIGKSDNVGCLQCIGGYGFNTIDLAWASILSFDLGVEMVQKFCFIDKLLNAFQGDLPANKRI